MKMVPIQRSEFNKQKILVTGGTGMVGRCLIQNAEKREDVILFAPTRSICDLRDQDSVRDYIKYAMPDVIIHAAALVGGIQANIANPYEFLQANIEINMNIIEEARRAGIKNFINIGSSCMYPRNHAEALIEESILTGSLEPTNEGYAISKIAGAKACEYISKNTSYHYRTIIPPNLYGPNDNFEPSRSHLVASIIQKIYCAIKQGQNEIEIWGDGTARREFLYADDLSYFIINIIPQIMNLPNMLNVGATVDHSVNEYYEKVAKVFSYSGKFVHNLDRPVGMTSKLMDSSKAKAFGWRPSTSLEAGLRLTANFYMGRS